MGSRRHGQTEKFFVARAGGSSRDEELFERFHIPTDWPVLVVEDTEDRISWFRKRMPKAVFAKNAEAAFRAVGPAGVQGDLP